MIIFLFTAISVVGCSFFEYPQPQLVFDNNNTLRILHLTDLHLGEDDQQDNSILLQIQDLITNTHCQLVVITGDLLSDYFSDTGFTYRNLRKLNNVFEKANMLYFYVRGNHDHYLDVSENEYINFTVSNFRLCLTKANPSGCTNFLVPIYKENKVVYSLWGIDGSRGILNSWGWLGQQEITWIQSNMKNFSDSHPGVKGLAFKHTPSVEFTLLSKMTNLVGRQAELVMCPKDKPSIIQILKPYGIIEGLFVGHDHLNDYSGIYEGIRLSYGVKTGKSGYNSIIGMSVAKLIVLQINEENKVSFNEWWVDSKGRLSTPTVFESLVQQVEGKCEFNVLIISTRVIVVTLLAFTLIIVIHVVWFIKMRRQPQQNTS